MNIGFEEIPGKGENTSKELAAKSIGGRESCPVWLEETGDIGRLQQEIRLEGNSQRIIRELKIRLRYLYLILRAISTC